MRYTVDVRSVITSPTFLVVKPPLVGAALLAVTFTVACDGCFNFVPPPDGGQLVDGGFTGNAPLAINEIMSSNGGTIATTRGAFDDWIEIVNLTDAAIDLTGFALVEGGNSGAFPPGTIIEPDKYLVVFCNSANP